MKVDHILEKGSGKINEDRLVMGENLFGVFDGATSLDPELSSKSRADRKTGGSQAASIARDVFARNHHPLTCLGQSANQAIFNRMMDSGVNLDQPEQFWSTSAAVVRLKNNTLEWFQTGDAQILLLGKDGTMEVLADRPDHDYPTLVMLKNSDDKSLSNPTLKTQVLKVRSLMNKRYGVLNGDPKAMEFTLSGTACLDRVKTILLFTDGLALPNPLPKPKKNFDDLAEDFRQLGLKGLHKKIRTIEKQDPNRHKFPRFKCHDDIAAISIDLE
ncbi:MAG: protein phosphatase 2C domain-containing protein [Desulfobacter sp.]|nr:protein phosphatase 2C domain-containing protein [Desulfobacter sp.]WDP88181.1 MAG: protein phosphatase 2C domain-containing protein [Desulfobacter sp.]